MIKTKRIQDILLEIRFEVNILSVCLSCTRDRRLAYISSQKPEQHRHLFDEKRSFYRTVPLSVFCLSMFVNPEQLPIILYG